MKYILFIILFFSSLQLFAQGNIELIQDQRVDRLVKKHIDFNDSKEGMDGYKIQIYFDSGNGSKSKAYGQKARFLAKYPDVEADMIFQEPNYKVRVGNFRTRMEAQGFLNEIKGDFESAFIVIDIINLPDIDAGDVEIEEAN